MTWEDQFQNAHALHLEGRMAEASAIYAFLVQQRSDAAPAWSLGGVVRLQAGDAEGALAYFVKAAELEPDQWLHAANRAQACGALGRNEEALLCWQAAIRLESYLGELHNELALCLRRLGRTSEAMDSFRTAVIVSPNLFEAWNNGGALLEHEGKRAESVPWYERAAQLKPDCADVRYNLASALLASGSVDAALQHYRKAGVFYQQERLAAGGMVDPARASKHADCLSNTGVALMQKNQFTLALAVFDKALQISPAFQMARYNRAFSLLTLGRLKEGWDDFECRWHFARREEPYWDGRPFSGQSLLIHHEQGIGDTIQMLRYATLCKERGGEVVVLCPVHLRRLAESAPGVDRVIVGEVGEWKPDWQVPAASLPRVFSTDLEEVPSPIPYFRVQPVTPTRIEGTRRIGLVWAGNPEHGNDARRSMKLSLLKPLFELPGIEWISLQKGAAIAQVHESDLEWCLADGVKECRDFYGTAQVVSGLDLVIGVDTSVIHLSGALGVPTWVLLPYSPDWRWMLDREDSPWYPTMRLFRQPSAGDWDALVSELVKALSVRLVSSA